MADRGHIIGSHSHTHPKVFSDLKPNEIKEEWDQSYAILKNLLGETNLTASLPNGRSSKEVLRYAFNAGFTSIYTSEPKTKIKKVGENSILGRFVVLENTSTDAVVNIVTSKWCRLKKYVKWLMVSLVKTMLGSFYGEVKAKILKH